MLTCSNVLKLRKLERQRNAEREASAGSGGGGQTRLKRHTLPVLQATLSAPTRPPQASTSISMTPRRQSEGTARAPVDARISGRVSKKRNRQLWTHRWNVRRPLVCVALSETHRGPNVSSRMIPKSSLTSPWISETPHVCIPAIAPAGWLTTLRRPCSSLAEGFG